MVHVGRARLRRRQYIKWPKEVWEPNKQVLGRNRLARSRPLRKKKCDKNGLASFLQDVGYPLREDPPVNVECAKEASLYQVTLEAPDRTKHLLLCSNHRQWVNEREYKLRDLNVKVTGRTL